MYLTMDIGATNTRIGASRDGRTFFAIEKFQTPRRFSAGMVKIIACVRRLQTSHPLHGLAVAMPGSLDLPQGKTLRLPNLPGWNNCPIVRTLKSALHTNMHIQLLNDADAAGIGEARRGAGRGFRRVAYFTISTGIGGARLINGKINHTAPQCHGLYYDTTAHHPTHRSMSVQTGECTMCSEPGHITLVPHGRKCGCGRRGCFEAYGSGTGFYKTYGMRPENCKYQGVWNEYARTLGQGIINAIEHPHLPHPSLPGACARSARLRPQRERDAADGVREPNRFPPHTHAPPDIIIIGGGVSEAGARLFTPLRAYIKKNLKIRRPPSIKKSALGDNAGLYGGLELLHKI